MDTSDYDNPVHYFLDDVWISLDPNRAVIFPTFIKKVFLSLEDDFFGETRVGIDLLFGEQNIAPLLFAEPLQLRIKERRCAITRV